MLTIKKYANGKLYDTLNKEYITKEQLTDIIRSKKKCKVVLSSTGKDVTKSVIAQVAATLAKKKDASSKPENIKKWIGNRIDSRINKMLEIMNLASKEQITKLNSGLKKLSQKVDELEKAQARHLSRTQKTQTRQTAKHEPVSEETDRPAAPVLGQNA